MRCSTKIRAEIKCGELLKDMAQRGERSIKGQHASSDTLSLEQIGIDAKESERFQRAAEAPKKAVEQAFREARESQVPVTSAAYAQSGGSWKTAAYDRFGDEIGGR